MSAANDAGAAAAELAVLFPDARVEVRDPDSGAVVRLVVREFRFREGLEAQVIARPLSAALAALVPEDAAAAPAADEVEEVLARHAALWLRLIGLACGREAAWLARLGDADGQAVSDAMWSANGAFFIRRVAALLAARDSRSSECSTRLSAPVTGAAMPTSPSV